MSVPAESPRRLTTAKVTGHRWIYSAVQAPRQADGEPDRVRQPGFRLGKPARPHCSARGWGAPIAQARRLTVWRVRT